MATLVKSQDFHCFRCFVKGLTILFNPDHPSKDFFQRTSAIDYPIPLSRTQITLMAALQQGSRWHIWEYIRVFGVDQWAIFLFLLVTLGLVIAIVNKQRTEVSIVTMPYLYKNCHNQG